MELLQKRKLRSRLLRGRMETAQKWVCRDVGGTETSDDGGETEMYRITWRGRVKT